jgi:hypothetical protein
MQVAIRDAIGNQPTLGAFNYATSSTDPEQLDSHAVEDGVSVLLQAPGSNGSKVYVGNESTQPIEVQPGGSVTVQVTDTSAIWVKATTSGDQLGVLYEDG